MKKKCNELKCQRAMFEYKISSMVQNSHDQFLVNKTASGTVLMSIYIYIYSLYKFLPHYTGFKSFQSHKVFQTFDAS